MNLKTRTLRLLLICGLAPSTAACGDDASGGDTDGGPATADTTSESGGASAALTAEEARPVIENYAALVSANYTDSLSTAQGLQTAVAAFTADPSAATQDAAKTAWLAAREPYGQTETFRFYGGPIDDDDGPEGQLNAWPMDESYVDYVEGMDDSGIINDPDADISKEALASLNEVGGEENVATGYHAIEFLLWGQDLSADGPGGRSFEDYVDPAPNFDRRALYIETVAELLIDDLTAVANEWDAGATGNYREQFLALPPEEAVENMLRGIGAMAAGELAEERINVALETKLQEDEHSCFSDNTHNDILFNFLAIKNVYYGDYGSVNGPGLDTLVTSRDPDLAAALDTAFSETEAAVRGIPAPFDTAIAGAADQAGPAAVGTAVDHLRELGDLLVEAGATMDITLNTALE